MSILRIRYLLESNRKCTYYFDDKMIKLNLKQKYNKRLRISVLNIQNYVMLYSIIKILALINKMKFTLMIA